MTHPPPRLRLVAALAWRAVLALAFTSCSAPAPDARQTAATAVRIHDIQGRSHRSPMDGRAVAGVAGFVTALTKTGFYLEDPVPDADPATSEAIFVYTAAAPTVAVGQYVLVSGKVEEYRPGGTSGAANLTTTQIVTPTVAPGGTPPAPLPPPVVIGAAGRVPPAPRIAASAPGGDVEAAGYAFDPRANALDFYESLEGMRVVVDDAVAVGPTTSHDEIAVVGSGGAPAALRSPRGGVVVTPTDFNPERILLAATLLPAATMPKVNVGDRLGRLQGVLDYSFGNFKLLLTAVPTRTPGPITRQTTTLRADAKHLTVGSFNVENLAPTDPPAKFAALGSAIAKNLRAPDVLALMEIQDNDGAVDDGVVDASTTIRMLVDAIHTAGGPSYSAREIDPVSDQDGGQPGGNIRQVLLFNPARVRFVDRPVAAPSTTAASAVAAGRGVRLSASPGRIAPADPAFNASRKPLVAEFQFGGKALFVIANHFNAKLGDGPLFGHVQPPAVASEAQRIRQADLVGGFVAALKRLDPQARVVVLGDLNDFQFSAALTHLKNAGGLADLVETLPENQRYTYVYDGNSEVLDHILVDEGMKRLAEYEVVHLNAEFFDQVSDHEPEVARLAIGR